MAWNRTWRMGRTATGGRVTRGTWDIEYGETECSNLVDWNVSICSSAAVPIGRWEGNDYAFILTGIIKIVLLKQWIFHIMYQHNLLFNFLFNLLVYGMRKVRHFADIMHKAKYLGMVNTVECADWKKMGWCERLILKYLAKLSRVNTPMKERIIMLNSRHLEL